MAIPTGVVRKVFRISDQLLHIHSLYQNLEFEESHRESRHVRALLHSWAMATNNSTVADVYDPITQISLDGRPIKSSPRRFCPCPPSTSNLPFLRYIMTILALSSASNVHNRQCHVPWLPDSRKSSAHYHDSRCDKTCT